MDADAKRTCTGKTAAEELANDTKSHENFHGNTNNFQPGTLEHWNKVRVCVHD